MEMTSMVFDRYNGRICFALDVVHTKTKISRKKKLIEITEYNGKNEVVSVKSIKTMPEKTEKLFEAVSQIASLHWKKDDYSVEVCDGWTWTVILRYGRRQRKISGTVKMPPYGEEIKQQVEVLTENGHICKSLRLF